MSAWGKDEADRLCIPLTAERLLLRARLARAEQRRGRAERLEWLLWQLAVVVSTVGVWMAWPHFSLGAPWTVLAPLLSLVFLGSSLWNLLEA